MDTGGSTSPFGPDTQSYWETRGLIFDLAISDLKLNRELLINAKPVALGRKLASLLPGGVVRDPMCGSGAIAIGMAQAGKRVLASDLDEDAVLAAAHNARAYGVADRITFRHEDVFTAIDRGGHDALYLDPPWGGPTYKNVAYQTLATLPPITASLFDLASSAVMETAITLPSNFDGRHITHLRRDTEIRWDDLGPRRVYLTLFFRSRTG